MPTYSITTQIYLNNLTQQYDKVISINKKPEGPLKSHIRQLYSRRLSEFKVNNSTFRNCIYAIINPETNNPFCYTEIDDFINFIVDEGYDIQYDLTKLMIKNKSRSSEMGNLLFYISYS